MEAVVVIGRRKWFVSALGVSVALLAVLALRTTTTFESLWVADSEAHGIDTALLIDTRGAPLTQVGDRGRGMAPDGEAGPGYQVRIMAASGASTLSVRLLAPDGTVAWSADLPAHRRAHLPRTELERAGVWRVEVSAPGRIGRVEVEGRSVASPWPRTTAGVALPLAWIAGGLVIALAVWRGSLGPRISAYVLLGLAVSWPFAIATTYWVFHDTPGAGMLGALTILLPASAGLALGWTRPHPDGPPPTRGEVVPGAAGATVALAVFLAAADDFLWWYTDPPAWPLLRDPLPAVVAFAGLVALGVSAWQVGRRTAASAAGSFRPVILDVIGTICGLGAAAVLLAGAWAAWFIGYGIGFADQGPNPGGGLVFLVVTIALTLVLAACWRVSFRFDHARRSEDGSRSRDRPRRERQDVAAR